jgi:hypothetical protein
MSVPEVIVPLKLLNRHRESASGISGQIYAALHMRARMRVCAYKKRTSHRPNFKITNKIETIMWDNAAWDSSGTVFSRSVGASHG